MASNCKVEFHRLLYKIALKLSQEEIDSLVTIEELPVAFKGKVPFTVLEQMVLQGIISESKPEKLAEVLKGINRMDLAKEAKDFSRTTKRSKKNHRSSEVQSDEQVSRVAIAANSEVTLVQTNILLAQLDRLTETVSEASQGSGRERVIEQVRKAKKQIESAERLLKTLHCISDSESDGTQSPSSDEEARSIETTVKGDTSTQPRKPIQETYSWTDSTSDEGVYEEVSDIRMAMLPTPVAATDEKKQSRPRPPTKPKPKARPSTIQPRVARPFLKQTTQDSTQSTRQPTNSYSNSDAYTRAGYDVDDAYYEDFTGSSDYTGTGTGDSGFGDAAFLRRIPLKPKAPTQSQLEASNECYESLTSARAGYYKSLNMETVEDVAYEAPQALYINVSRN